MSDRFPKAEFHGVDISEIYPSTICPPNAHFKFGNVLERLPFEDGEFEYVRVSLLGAAIRKDDWPRVITELKRVTKPGGWIEQVEMDLLPKEIGPIQARFIDNRTYSFFFVSFY